MKTEINNENKAKFFAQYWGQFIGTDIDRGYDSKHVIFGDSIKYTDFINLKPLSSISDEDAIEVAKLSDTAYNLSAETGRAIVWSGIKKYIPSPFLMWDIQDYLRSKGYALPWMGLSVQDMIESKWIKLI